MLDSTGTVWVADFGLAKYAEQDNVSRTGDIVGTLSYIPPESFSGQTDARGDIYSLGLSLFELLTLRPAFFGRDRSKLVREITEGQLPRLRKLNPNIPRDLETIVLKAVAHRPEDRYATASEMASDLNCYLNDLPIKARRMSIPEQFTRWYRRNKLVAALSAAVLSLLMALTIVFGITGYRATQASDRFEEQAQIANEARRTAEKERQNARDFAFESIQALKSVFDGFVPLRLPVSDSSTLCRTRITGADQLSVIEQTDTATDNADETQPAELVAPPPIKQETAARLEILLVCSETLAEKAGNNSDFASTFADLCSGVGTLHKALGNAERAMESLDKAIARYESLVAKSDSIENIIGLAVCFNEKADLLGSINNSRESQDLFKSAHQLLEKEEENGRLQKSPVHNTNWLGRCS